MADNAQQRTRNPLRIVVLDGYTLNPGDLTWAGLEALGPCTIHDHTTANEVVARAQDAGIVLTNKTVQNVTAFLSGRPQNVVNGL